jgi:hypothetical protein
MTADAASRREIQDHIVASRDTGYAWPDPFDHASALMPEDRWQREIPLSIGLPDIGMADAGR